jgi:hypothetical protein
MRLPCGPARSGHRGRQLFALNQVRTPSEAVMQLRLLPSVASLCLVAAIALACGSSSFSGAINNTSIPQSITVSPLTANAQQYPDGQVTFVATGYFQSPPSPVSPLQARWGVCFQNSATTEVSITQTGVAQCQVGAKGAYMVFASRMTMCTAITACGGGCQVSGFATLTCP